MPSLDDLRAELDDLAARVERVHGVDLDAGRSWVCFGSFVLYLHRLREQFGDVDIFVSPAMFDRLGRRPQWSRRRPDPADPPYLERSYSGVPVHVFADWTAKDPEVDARQCRRASERVHDWPCAFLDVIRLHKAMSRKHGPDAHPKHALDVAAIDRFHATGERVAAERLLEAPAPLALPVTTRKATGGYELYARFVQAEQELAGRGPLGDAVVAYRWQQLSRRAQRAWEHVARAREVAA